MKTLTAALAIALVCALAPAAGRAAAEEEGSKLAALSSWFKNLKNGLADSAVRGKYQPRRVSAAAAVRGDERSVADPDRPEWKTSSKSDNVQQRKERTALASAIDLIVAGKFDEGKTAIDAFEKDHPRSGLLAEAKKARENADLLAQMRGAQAPSSEDVSTTPAEQKPAEKPAEAEKDAASEKVPEPEKPADAPVSAEPKAN